MEYYKAISFTALSLLLLINMFLSIKNTEASSKDSSSSSLSSSSSSSSSSSTLSLKLTQDQACSDPVCHNFSVGDTTRGEFYSPNYPNDYPNSTNCCRTIVAPYGQYIKLEFRDSFKMEFDEKCENDYLEIRDGRHGYSKVLRKLCGEQTPGDIISTGNALWLKFHSDENIEYSGFRAVYTFQEHACKYSTDCNHLFNHNYHDHHSPRVDAHPYSPTSCPPFFCRTPKQRLEKTTLRVLQQLKQLSSANKSG